MRVVSIILLMLLSGLFVSCSSNSQIAAPESATTEIPGPASSTVVTQDQKIIREIHLGDGSIVFVDENDTVEVHDPETGLTSRAGCGTEGLKYDQIVEFWTAFTAALEEDDRGTVAQLTLFPLRWNRMESTETLESADHFLDHYDEIFTPSLINEALKQEVGAVFCRNGGFMLGNGLFWGTGIRDDLDSYGLEVVNGSGHEERSDG